MATTPQFANKARCGVGTLSAANTSRGGDGTLVTVFTAGSTSGSRVDRIYVTATSTTTAGMVRIFSNDTGTATSSNRLLVEVPVLAITPGASTPAWSAPSIWFDGGLMLEPSFSLKAATHNAENFVVHVVAGDF